MYKMKCLDLKSFSWILANWFMFIHFGENSEPLPNTIFINDTEYEYYDVWVDSNGTSYTNTSTEDTLSESEDLISEEENIDSGTNDLIFDKIEDESLITPNVSSSNGNKIYTESEIDISESDANNFPDLSNDLGNIYNPGNSLLNSLNLNEEVKKTRGSTTLLDSNETSVVNTVNSTYFKNDYDYGDDRVKKQINENDEVDADKMTKLIFCNPRRLFNGTPMCNTSYYGKKELFGKPRLRIVEKSIIHLRFALGSHVKFNQIAVQMVKGDGNGPVGQIIFGEILHGCDYNTKTVDYEKQSSLIHYKNYTCPLENFDPAEVQPQVVVANLTEWNHTILHFDWVFKDNEHTKSPQLQIFSLSEGEPCIMVTTFTLMITKSAEIDSCESRITKFSTAVVEPIHFDPSYLSMIKKINDEGDFFAPLSNEEIAKSAEAAKADTLDTFKSTDFYEGCDETKFCIGDVHDCLNIMSCTSAMSFRKDDIEKENAEIELYARTGKYIALGLSRDKYMGEDTVVECIREHNAIRIYRSWNQKRERRNNRRLADQSAISLKNANYQDGWIYCKFIWHRLSEVKTKARTFKFDLAKEKFHILLARGDDVKAPTKTDPGAVGIGYHGGGVSATKRKYALLDPVGESKARIIMEKIHGVTCCLAWLLLFPIATFFVRYFKETYHNKFIFGFTIWYGMHLILICTVVGLTTLSVLLLQIGKLVDSHMRPPDWNAHSYCGLGLLGVTYIQFGLGIFISKNKNPQYLWIYNLHCFIGQGSTFLTFTTIYTSREIKHGLPCSIPGALITYAIMYMLIHLMMSYQVCYIDYVQGETSSRVYSLTGLRPARVTDLEPEAPGSGFRKIILGIFIIVSFITTAIVVIMYLANLEDCFTINSHKKGLVEEDGDESEVNS